MDERRRRGRGWGLPFPPNTGQQMNQAERFLSGIGLRSRYYR
jgi:hypothetical protein